ncbi:basic amino acid ABC transporter substrate-binding protein [Chitiniphilus purpureus]|uniref:Basic amino acid ABC transporter substrate-binding protein n=1 Tax=Chitiniphilus purpureus TaxID=2981137 RepID=A0ABY6DKV1_9NEIS|nr:basic amino acid ABC transporter substrate-binding protein [Chitiniphilus sp. CD1]UXY14999.1 basic amino acid ABC transporter substrate-binding protein [Chitiniphilus sp. CD1]
MSITRRLFVCLLGSVCLASSAFAADKVYQVASDAAYAPFESLNAKQEVVGFDVDVLSAAAAKAGFKVKFHNTPWEGIFATLAMGDRDIVASAVTITPERKRSMDFSDPYFEAKQLIAVAANSAIGKFADLKGKKVGVQTGTTGDEVVQKLLGKTNPNIKRFESTPLALQELLAGGVDAVVADNGVVVNFITHNKGSKLKTLDDPSFTKEYYGFAVKKGNAALLARINRGLAVIKTDGTYDQIYKKYFGR